MKSFYPVVAAIAVGGMTLSFVNGQDLAGKWSPPPERGGSVLHEGTKLAFPPKLADYELAGIFDFSTEEGMFVRYVSDSQRSRADVFLFPLVDKPSELEAKQRVILGEIDAVIFRLEEMIREGVYKDLKVADLKVGTIELWKEEALPLGSRQLEVTRIGQKDQGTVEAKLIQWIGATVFRDYSITIRHLRPQSSGEAGEKSMESFAAGVIQLIKDPSLQAEVEERLKLYAADPLGSSAVENTAVVLAYLNQSLSIPTLVPAPPLTTWLDDCERASEGAKQILEHAFVMGHANHILKHPDASMDDRLEAATWQMVEVYEKMKQRRPEVQQAQLDQLQKAVRAGNGAEYLKERT